VRDVRASAGGGAWGLSPALVVAHGVLGLLPLLRGSPGGCYDRGGETRADHVHPDTYPEHPRAALYERLKDRATLSNRSVQAEALELLETAVPADGGLPAELPEAITADTAVVLTVSQMAEKFDSLGTPTTQPETELSVDPDEHPLFQFFRYLTRIDLQKASLPLPEEEAGGG
jgi:hypothetical protein